MTKTKKKATKAVVKAKPFSRLSKVEKRKAIARDVIAQIRLKVYEAEEGSYVDITPTDSNTESSIYNCQIDNLIDKKEVSCTCCGIGSLVISHVHKTNNLKLGQSKLIGSNELIKERMKSIFSKTQLDLIETIFEKEIICDSCGYLRVHKNYSYYLTPLAKAAIKFGRSFRNPNERLIAIMKKIIQSPIGEVKFKV